MVQAPRRRKEGHVGAPYAGRRWLFKDSPGSVAAPVRTDNIQERPDTAGKGRFEFALIINPRAHTRVSPAD